MKQTSLRSHCPINFALETFGDKWTLLVVRDMVFYAKHTYGEFLKSEEGIATNILADRLALLERQGIVYKTPHLTDKRKDMFFLTDKGMDLIPILLRMEVWSGRHDIKTAAEHAFVRAIETNEKKVASEIRDAVMANQEACLVVSF